MRAYYNEIDAHAVAWLRNLVAAGLLPEGDVDDRSIVDVRSSDLDGYGQCHFFAGIGGWPLILALAGWPPLRPVWTGSCPCQPFSVAGRRGGEADARHLYPEFSRLIGERRPAIVFGEQVASAAGRAWLAAVRLDLEALGYACGAADLCAAGVGAPHMRQRLWWVAQGLGIADGERRLQVDGTLARERQSPDGGSGAGRLGDACRDRSQGRLLGWQDQERQAVDGQARRDGAARGLADAGGARPQGHLQPAGANAGAPGGAEGAGQQRQRVWPVARHGGGGASDDGAGEADGFWRDADWLHCRDGRWRPVEPGTFPLAHGVPGRVGKLRAYGNAVVPQAGAEFVRAVMEAMG